MDKIEFKETPSRHILMNLKFESVYPKMIPARKRQLVAALRSGEYEQAYGALCRISDIGTDMEKTGYCCLGVGCMEAVHWMEVSLPAFQMMQARRDAIYGENGELEGQTVGWEGQFGHFPDPVVEYFWGDDVFKGSLESPIFFGIADREVVRDAEMDWHGYDGQPMNWLVRSEYSAIGANDTLKLTFDQIADLFDFFF